MSKQIKLWFTLFPFSHQTIQSSASDWGAAAFGPLGLVHMCPLMYLVPLPLFNQFIMLSVGLYSIRSGPSTLILTRLDKASCFMLVLAVVLILLTELKPLSPVADPGPLMLGVLDRWTPTANVLQTQIPQISFHIELFPLEAKDSISLYTTPLSIWPSGFRGVPFLLFKIANVPSEWSIWTPGACLG